MVRRFTASLFSGGFCSSVWEVQKIAAAGYEADRVEVAYTAIDRRRKEIVELENYFEITYNKRQPMDA